MENQDFAKIFFDMAELLELKEDNPFRIRAYQKAAHNIEAMPESLEKIYEEGGLKALENVPGIGKGIAEHIEELIRTGKLKSREQLFGKFPKGLLDIVAVPGIGPKTAMLAYKKLKIDSIDKLKKAAEAGALEKLPGVRSKKIANILAGIELKQRSKGRFSIGEALPYAESIVAELKKLKQTGKIMPCGSLRRGQETIGDIDILVTSVDPGAIMDRFVELPQVERILGKGPTKSSVILKNGMQADVRVVEPSSYGAAVHYFTGNKSHNILIREMGIKKGLKVNEYGIFRGNRKIGGQKEEDVFKAFGLPFIPPELRNGTDEIDAAKAGELPHLIELSDIRGDLHMHTTATDGSNTIEEMAEAAKKLGYEYVAITDHSLSTRVAGGLTKAELSRNLKLMEKAAARVKGIRILKGSEVDILPDGSLDYPDEALKELDVVSASVHSNFNMGKAEMTRRVIKAMRNRYVKVISHPTCRLIGEREPIHLDMDEVLKAAKDSGTFMELNSHPSRLDLNDGYCREAKNIGVTIVINTDSHSVSQLNNMRYGILTARRGWLEKKDVLNCLPLAKLLKALAQKLT